MLVTIVAVALATFLIALKLKDLLAVRRLPTLPTRRRPDRPPTISLLIPARNEARVIQRCVRGALSQNYPDYEVIVVDDSSSDGTGAILRRLQTEDRRLRVIEAGPLPPGWKGKQHALTRGYAHASGEWLLFLDADTAPGPQLLSSLAAFADEQRIDMLTALPLLELGSFWERAILPAFTSLIAAVFPMSRVNDPTSDIAMANGQCIFISRRAYEAVGGHAAVRDSIAEDVALARRVKHAGLRLFMVDGRHLLRVRMYHNGREVMEGLAKNAMSGVQIGGVRTLLGVTRQTLLALGPLLLLATALWAHLRRWPQRRARAIGTAAAVEVPLAVWSWGRMYRTIFDQPARYGLLYPLGIVAYGLIGLYAALRLRFGRGVVWKGRRYPL